MELFNLQCSCSAVCVLNPRPKRVVTNRQIQKLGSRRSWRSPHPVAVIGCCSHSGAGEYCREAVTQRRRRPDPSSACDREGGYQCSACCRRKRACTTCRGKRADKVHPHAAQRGTGAVVRQDIEGDAVANPMKYPPAKTCLCIICISTRAPPRGSLQI
jgi:hypothetical protein